MAAKNLSCSAIRTKKKLKGLYPLLHSWTELVSDFCAADSFEDNPWWYNERASLSTLAGAAWRLPKWSALEEFSTTKRGRVPHKKVQDGRIVRGRCDLYVAHATTSFGIEAKQAWQPIGRRAKKDHLHIALQAATRDAGNLTPNQADHRLGLVFASPYIPVSEVSSPGPRGTSVIDPMRVRTGFDRWISSLKLNQYDAYAYIFVGRCEQFVGEGAIPRVFPGVLIAIKRCKTGTKRPKA